jgi:hypothetical protein
MRAQPARSDKPSPAAIIERAYSLANEAMFTIAMQRRRLRSVEPEDGKFVFRWWADLQFMILALNRLRLAALVAGKARGVKIGAALKNYDAALPLLKSMRDVGEHIDVYAVDSSKRFNKDISRRQLQTGTWDGTTFSGRSAEHSISIVRAKPPNCSSQPFVTNARSSQTNERLRRSFKCKRITTHVRRTHDLRGSRNNLRRRCEAAA